MLFRLILLFTLVPFVELILLLQLAQHTSISFTLLVILVTGLVGAMLVRLQGIATMLRMRRQMAQGQVPADAIQDGVLLLVAGALLITPGLLTDLVGFALLVPACRRVLKRWVARRFWSAVEVRTYRWVNRPDDDPRESRYRGQDDEHKIIDVRVVEPPDEDRDRPSA